MNKPERKGKENRLSLEKWNHWNVNALTEMSLTEVQFKFILKNYSLIFVDRNQENQEIDVGNKEFPQHIGIGK